MAGEIVKNDGATAPATEVDRYASGVHDCADAIKDLRGARELAARASDGARPELESVLVHMGANMVRTLSPNAPETARTILLAAGFSSAQIGKVNELLEKPEELVGVSLPSGVR